MEGVWSLRQKDALFLGLCPRIAFELDNGVVSDSFGTEEDVAFEPHLPIWHPGLFPFSLSLACSIAPRYACVSALSCFFAKWHGVSYKPRACLLLTPQSESQTWFHVHGGSSTPNQLEAHTHTWKGDFSGGQKRTEAT